MTANYNNTLKFICLFGLLILAVGMMLALSGVSSAGVTYSAHAVKHDEAYDIRRCLDSNGPYMVMKHKYFDTWYLICQLEHGLWGLQAVTKTGAEKTAFSPGDGSWQALKEYFGDWAIRFKGALPWLR